MNSKPPKMFISYSWTTPDHEAWVLDLASDLRDNGVDVTLDKWDLHEGQDAYAFMEKMVADKEITKVLLICDRAYAKKADERSGGVGTEAQIISPEIYAKEDQRKFVAVVTERDVDGTAFLPAYYKSRIYIDLSDNSRFTEGFERLLRWAYDKPLHVKPEVGKAPEFLTTGTAVTLGTATKARRAIEAIRGGRDYWAGALAEYFTAFAGNLERFRMQNGEGERDELLIENIEAFLPSRNEAVEVFLALAQYQDGDRCAQLLHGFFESLSPYMDRPESVTRWTDGDFDNFRFIVHELFLYAIAHLLKYERFDTVGTLLRTHFYLPNAEIADSNGMVSFNHFWRGSRLLEHRKRRLRSGRLSLHADLLEERSHETGVPFAQLMQADFVLFIRDCLDSLSTEKGWLDWWPITLAYTARYQRAFELFARSQSNSYFSRLCGVFDITSKSELEALLLAFKEGKRDVPKWEFVRIDPGRLMAFESIGTRP